MYWRTILSKANVGSYISIDCKPHELTFKIIKNMVKSLVAD